MRSGLSHFGSYTLCEVIGTGSMGVVYKALRAPSDQPIALKTLRLDTPWPHEDPVSALRARQDALAAAQLSHAGIVAVHDYGEAKGQAYIAMEYVDGKSLREALKSARSFDISRAVEIVSQLLCALQHAHEHGVLHRDVKPSNVLTDRRGQVKLVDFGIACTRAMSGTGVDEVLGTAGFIAPEVYCGHRFDGRVDVFGAGAVLYELLAGEPPFRGRPDQIMFQVCNGAPPPPSLVRGGRALRRLDCVVQKAITRRPEDRFTTAGHMREALLRAI